MLYFIYVLLFFLRPSTSKDEKISSAGRAVYGYHMLTNGQPYNIVAISIKVFDHKYRSNSQ